MLNCHKSTGLSEIHHSLQCVLYMSHLILLGNLSHLKPAAGCTQMKTANVWWINVSDAFTLGFVTLFFLNLYKADLFYIWTNMLNSCLKLGIMNKQDQWLRCLVLMEVQTVRIAPHATALSIKFPFYIFPSHPNRFNGEKLVLQILALNCK